MTHSLFDQERHHAELSGDARVSDHHVRTFRVEAAPGLLTMTTKPPSTMYAREMLDT